MRSVDPYEDLANGIILQAVADYRRLWDRDINDKDKQKIIRFFRSQWFVILTRINADWLIDVLEKEANAKRKKVYGIAKTLP